MKRILTLLALCGTLSATAQTDTTVGIKAPGRVSKNVAELSHYLCDPLPDDHAKVNAIYNWITHNIRYDVKAMQQGSLKEEKPAIVLKKKKAVCDGYSKLFAALCKEANIPAVVVEGYAKDWLFDNGDSFYIPRHAWNAVSVNGQWHLVDVTWGAGGVGQAPGWLQSKLNKVSKNPVNYSGKLKFRFHYDTTYFLQDPAAFRIKHLPADPVWQLCDSAMPLKVFEAGQKSIESFNLTWGTPERTNPLLDELAKLDPAQMMVQSADRMYAYNDRYHLALAAKHQLTAVDNISGSAQVEDTDWEAVHKEVQQDLKSSESLVKDQKKTMGTQYAALKKKNKTKNTEAKKYVTSLHLANKKMISLCESRSGSAAKKIGIIQDKAVSLRSKIRRINPGAFNRLATKERQDETSNPALLAIEDSLTARDGRLLRLQAAGKEQQEKITGALAQKDVLLDSLAKHLYIADSALVQETISRINMHDGLDDEVVQWSGMVKEFRIGKVDTLQRLYMAADDSIHRHYEALRKNQTDQLDIHRKNLKDMEQYKRRNSTNTAVLQQHGTRVEALQSLETEIMTTLSEHRQFLKDNRVLYGRLTKLYRHQERLADYMEKAEKHRQELEEQTLTKKEAFDKKENAYQQQLIKRTGKQAEKFIKERS